MNPMTQPGSDSSEAFKNSGIPPPPLEDLLSEPEVQEKKNKMEGASTVHDGHSYKEVVDNSSLATDLFSKMQDEALQFDNSITKSDFDAKLEQTSQKMDELIARFKGPEQSVFSLVEKKERLRDKMLAQYAEGLHQNIEKESITTGKKKISAHETAIKQHSPETGRLAADFEKHLHIRSSDDFISPLKDDEEAFIDRYLANSPSQLKQQAHFEMLQRQIDSLPKAPVGKEMAVQLGEQTYRVYDIDEAEYQFIGCAEKFTNVASDYAGYCEGKGRYLCTSLIDQEHPFFKEWEQQYSKWTEQMVFQIFSIPPKAIVHTSPIDIYSPLPPPPLSDDSEISRKAYETSRRIESGWYAQSLRAQVLADHIDNAYNQFAAIKAEKGLLPMSTSFDQKSRLRNRADTFFRDVKGKVKAEHQQYIRAASNLLTDSRRRSDLDHINEVLKELRDNAVLEEKDIKELESIVNLLHELESNQMEFNEYNFEKYDYSVNRVFLQLQTLIDYYRGQTNLSESEKKEEFRRLFLTDDPKGEYNIVQELIATEDLLKRIPQKLSLIPGIDYCSHKTRLNRFMGPGEVISQSMESLNNEINIDTSRGGGIKVKGWIISKRAINSDDPVEKKELQLLCELAKKEGIPILTRDWQKPGLI